MGYRIIYFQEDKRPTRYRAILLTLLFLSIFLGWTFRNWEEESSLILGSVFPVMVEEARDAAGEIVEQIGEGGGVVQAFADFYHRVFPGEMEGPY